MGPTGYFWHSKPVKGYSQSVDLEVKTDSLLIMVDGEQHISKKYCSTTLQKQQSIDRKFNSLALDQGYNVMRIHYADVDCVSSFLEYVLGKCKQVRKGSRILAYSSSFHTSAIYQSTGKINSSKYRFVCFDNLGLL